MVKYVIEGGKRLTGHVSVGGSKNATLPILAGTVLCAGTCIIGNMPQIHDVTVQLEILSRLGAKVRMLDDNRVEIDCTKLRTSRAAYDDLMRQNRASYYFLGALLGRYGSASVSMPGGCNLGVRSIDQHIKGFEAMGANVEVKNGVITATAEDGLQPAKIYFDVGTVGGTINLMLAAARTPGLTVLENANKEPHIVDVANFLNSMGAEIRGAGTDVIKIKGKTDLHGTEYNVIPDQIEAGTFIAAAAATGGEVYVDNVIPKHLECFTVKFREMGIDVEDLGDSVLVRRSGSMRRVNIKTMRYPGFPTDMQPVAVVLACLAEGTSIINEDIFSNRFRYVDELRRMGAKIQVDENIAVVEGTEAFSGAAVQAFDLRAGAAMVVAGLAAEGTTEMQGVTFVERGYEMLVEKLRALGADIRRVEEPDAVLEENA